MPTIADCTATYGSDGVHLSITAYLRYGEELHQDLGSEELDPRLSAYENLTAAADRYIHVLFGGRAPQPIRLPSQLLPAGHSGQVIYTRSPCGSPLVLVGT